jgi:nicotinamidase-related amidase
MMKNQSGLTRNAVVGFSKIILTAALLVFYAGAFSQEKRFENEKFVVVLDVQQYWTDKVLSKEASAEMLSSINALIEKSDPAKVIYITSVHKALTISFKGIKVDTLLNNDFDRSLKIINNNIFVKTAGDAFTSKQFTDFLEQNNAKEIIITGLLAEKCVTATTLGGLSMGFDIYLIPETIGGKSQKSKGKVIEKLVKEGAKILDDYDLKKN